MTPRGLIAIDGRLEPRPLPDAAVGPTDVRIAIAATAVNRADLLQRAGNYPPPPGASPVLGLECAGTVVEAGAQAGIAVGARVAALLTAGGYADEVVCPADHTLPAGDLPFEVAAALPEALCTAYLNLVVEAGIRPGERAIVHAAASGVGTVALQLLAARGNPTWATAGSDAKIAACIALGAAGGTVRHRGRWVDDVLAWTDGAGVDVALDPVGAAYLEDHQRALAVGGRLVVIGLMGGRSATLDLGRLLVKRQRVIGSVLRSRSNAEKAALIRAIRDDAWPLCLAGRVTPPICAELPLDRAEEAHALVASDATIGKAVLRVR